MLLGRADHLGRRSRSPTSPTTRSGSSSPAVAFGVYVLARLARAGARPSAARRRGAAAEARRLMFAHEFVRNAFLAGTVIAMACGLVGLLRRAARPGVRRRRAQPRRVHRRAGGRRRRHRHRASGCSPPRSRSRSLLGALGERAHADDVTIGIVFAAILGLGVSVPGAVQRRRRRRQRAARRAHAVRVDLRPQRRRRPAGRAGRRRRRRGAPLAIARPLLFASVDPGVAAARGVPVRALGLLFLALLGATAGRGDAGVGALLLLGLLAAPAGAAHRLTRQPLPRARAVGRARRALRSGSG